MAEDPVTIVKGGTLAQNIIGTAPEGMLIAPSWKRVLAFMLDMMLISIVLGFFTNFRLLEGLFNYELLTEGGRYTAEFFMNWFVFCAAFYLYFKYTGQTMVVPSASVAFASPSSTTTAPCSNNTTGATCRGQDDLHHPLHRMALLWSARHVQCRFHRGRVSHGR